MINIILNYKYNNPSNKSLNSNNEIFIKYLSYDWLLMITYYDIIKKL